MRFSLLLESIELIRPSLSTNRCQKLDRGWIGRCLTIYTGLQKQCQGHKISEQKENPDQLCHFTDEELGPREVK